MVVNQSLKSRQGVFKESDEVGVLYHPGPVHEMRTTTMPYNLTEKMRQGCRLGCSDTTSSQSIHFRAFGEKHGQLVVESGGHEVYNRNSPPATDVLKQYLLKRDHSLESRLC